jgi:sialate O-acetylesterase
LFDDYLRRCTQYEDGSTKKLYKAALRRWLTLAQEYRDHPDPQSNLLPPRPSPPRNPRIDQHSPTLLYNGMIAPLVPYAIRGVVWYHGDSNGSTANKYYLLLKTMIEDWRARWGLDLTVLIVQCANINSPEPYPVSHGSVPIIREAQLLASMLPNVGLAVTIDIGERDSHPRNKQEVGRRLSLLARHMTYKECIPCQGPIYESMKMERREIRLFFRNAEGLTSIGPLNAFAVAGPEGNFVRGEAIIDGETVVVSSNSIAIPVAVRYGWSDNPSTALYNKHGLPAPPFRTDQYPIV